MKSLASLFPNASQDCHAANPQLSPATANKTISRAIGGGQEAYYEVDHQCEIQCSKSKRDQTAALGGSVQGKEKGVQRVVVRFTGFRTRPLDPDNFSGGCKDLLDGLRHAGLISGDEPWRIDFQTAQEKVAHRYEERTVIEINLGD